MIFWKAIYLELFHISLSLLFVLPCCGSVTTITTASSSEDPLASQKLRQTKVFDDEKLVLDSRLTVELPRLLAHFKDWTGGGRSPEKIDWHGVAAEAAKRSLVEANNYGKSQRPHFETYDCKNKSGYYNDAGSWISPKCSLISNSANKINTKDQVVNWAHNHLIDVYDFYKTWLNVDLMQIVGVLSKSYVHYGMNFTGRTYNPILDGIYYVPEMEGFAFDDGDGVSWTTASKCLDTVAWFLSFVVYILYTDAGWWENTALMFGFANCMGATVDRLYGKKNLKATWTIGEDCDLNGSDGLGWLSISDGTWDGVKLSTHYDDRNRNTPLGIVETWFYLMVAGGKHPKSKITVPPLEPDLDKSIAAGAKLFFDAVTKCFSISPDFFAARTCTLKFASKEHKASVAKAWDAVGIFHPVFRPLASGLRLTGLACGVIGETYDELFFRMNETVQAGSNVTCKLQGHNWNCAPNLYVKFGSRPEGSNLTDDCNFNNYDCHYHSKSIGTPQCTTRSATRNNTKVYVTIQAWEATTDMTLECFINDGCKTKNMKCSNASECCGSYICDGPSKEKRVCKPCINPCPSWSFFCGGPNHACTRSTECCKDHPTCNSNRRCQAKG